MFVNLQGKNVIDASAQVGLPHLVFSGGDPCREEVGLTVPMYEPKWELENYIVGLKSGKSRPPVSSTLGLFFIYLDYITCRTLILDIKKKKNLIQLVCFWAKFNFILLFSDCHTLKFLKM